LGFWSLKTLTLPGEAEAPRPTHVLLLQLDELIPTHPIAQIRQAAKLGTRYHEDYARVKRKIERKTNPQITQVSQAKISAKEVSQFIDTSAPQ